MLGFWSFEGVKSLACASLVDERSLNALPSPGTTFFCWCVVLFVFRSAYICFIYLFLDQHNFHLAFAAFRAGHQRTGQHLGEDDSADHRRHQLEVRPRPGHREHRPPPQHRSQLVWEPASASLSGPQQKRPSSHFWGLDQSWVANNNSVDTFWPKCVPEVVRG